MTLRERLERYIEDLMRQGGIEHLSDKEDILDSVMQDFCRYCELREDCDLCHSAKDEIETAVSDYL